jgi:HPt (histidine-containing phosphotransfer) domain-containing protein
VGGVAIGKAWVLTWKYSIQGSVVKAASNLRMANSTGKKSLSVDLLFFCQKNMILCEVERMNALNRIKNEIENTNSDINEVVGLKYYLENTDLYLKILKSYATSIRPMITILQDFSSENLHEYRSTVHAIKGASLGIYAEKLSEMAKQLQFAADEGKLEFIKGNNENFIQSVLKLICAIEQEMPDS